MKDNSWYPDKLMVGDEGTKSTYEFMESLWSEGDSFHYAELGIYRGATCKNIRKRFPNANIHIFDFEENVNSVVGELGSFTFGYTNTQRYNDSYNWSLMKLIEARQSKPLFDYIFLDGAHTVAIDALAFFLCDKLLKVGGYIDFDDYHWRLKGSSLDPDKVPEIKLQYTEEQIESKQVAMIVDTLVRTDSRYEEVLENKVFRKIKA